jgi:hypothetical protein
MRGLLGLPTFLIINFSSSSSSFKVGSFYSSFFTFSGVYSIVVGTSSSSSSLLSLMTSFENFKSSYCDRGSKTAASAYCERKLFDLKRFTLFWLHNAAEFGSE